MTDDRPAWARRMTNEREARGWSQAEAIRNMRMYAPVKPIGGDLKQVELPDNPSLLRMWKRWEKVK